MHHHNPTTQAILTSSQQASSSNPTSVGPAQRQAARAVLAPGGARACRAAGQRRAGHHTARPSFAMKGRARPITGDYEVLVKGVSTTDA
eukprot:4393711-Pleurochrysis_carterae.AAC.1